MIDENGKVVFRLVARIAGAVAGGVFVPTKAHRCALVAGAGPAFQFDLTMDEAVDATDIKYNVKTQDVVAVSFTNVSDTVKRFVFHSVGAPPFAPVSPKNPFSISISRL